MNVPPRGRRICPPPGKGGNGICPRNQSFVRKRKLWRKNWCADLPKQTQEREKGQLNWSGAKAAPTVHYRREKTSQWENPRPVRGTGRKVWETRERKKAVRDGNKKVQSKEGGPTCNEERLPHILTRSGLTCDSEKNRGKKGTFEIGLVRNLRILPAGKLFRLGPIKCGGGAKATQ